MDVTGLLDAVGVRAAWTDCTFPGKGISVAFNGNLREEQVPAAEAMLKHNTGVLAATTAFGKTVIAAKPIAERKVKTLILTHRRQLLSQWTATLSEFLKIGEALPALEKKRGLSRSKRRDFAKEVNLRRYGPSLDSGFPVN